MYDGIVLFWIFKFNISNKKHKACLTLYCCMNDFRNTLYYCVVEDLNLLKYVTVHVVLRIHVFYIFWKLRIIRNYWRHVSPLLVASMMKMIQRLRDKKWRVSTWFVSELIYSSRPYSYLCCNKKNQLTTQVCCLEVR